MHKCIYNLRARNRWNRTQNSDHLKKNKNGLFDGTTEKLKFSVTPKIPNN